MKKVIIFLFVSVTSCQLQAQNVYTQYLHWIRYQNQLIFSPKVSWVNEIDNRRFFNPNEEFQFIGHSHVHYLKGRWDFAAGMSFSWAYASQPEKPYHVTQEMRPFLQVSLEHPIKKISIQSRVRLDDRFIQAQAGEGVFDKYINLLRFRYRLQFTFPLKKNEGNVTTMSLKFADEIMLNNRLNTFDQNRIYLTTDFLLSKQLTLETGYIYIYQQKLGQDVFFSRNVLRISLTHKIWLYKK